jgi:formate hydrogenlyase subunit 3/multisubunit Na+/H+ antiporter MnhD subunit
MIHDRFLLLLVCWPLFGALLVPWLGRRSERVRDGWVLVVTGASLAGAVLLVMRVGSEGLLHASLPLLIGHLAFAADQVSALFALFSAFVWFSATLYSIAYMKTQRARDRYHAVSLVVLAAMFGVVLAGDLVTLFLFFETLGLAAFLLVVHTGTPEARRAAVQYFWMTIMGGVALLSGIMMVYTMGGGSLLPAMPPADAAGYRAAAAGLLVLGFGVKAGMVPVHFWLPNAHPVAPSPASALLSGVMIKAGAYGIFRSLSAVFGSPGAGELDSDWVFSAQFGLVVTWLGIITMALGVVMALGQSNAKRMLAYHSISQMGFILAGLGAGAFLLGEGSMGTTGGLLHTVNHALFKACLFLGVGAVAFRAGSLDMYALGGLWRRMPFTFAVMLVAAAGITGLPLFNGFVSKSMIHHALEAAHADSGLGSLQVAERIFILTAAGTAASFIKLIGLVFLGRSKLENPQAVREAPPAMLLAMGLLAGPIILLGWQPGWLLNSLLAPGLAAAGMSVEGIGHYLGHYFLSSADVLMSVGIFLLGGVIFTVGMKFGLFHLHLPERFRVETWFRRAGRALNSAVTSRTTARAGSPTHRRGTVLAAAEGISKSYERASKRGGGMLDELLLAAVEGISQGYERARRQGGGLLGELLLAVFRGITRIYGWVQQRVAWSIRAGRRRFVLGMAEAGLARRQLVESVLVGLPGSPSQAFLEAAWGAIEAERHATIRAVLKSAGRGSGQRPARDEGALEAQAEAARALAGLMAGAVFEARLARLGELARQQGVEAARAGLAELHRHFGPTREAIRTASLELADARSRGEDIVREVAERLAPVLEGEAQVMAAGSISTQDAEREHLPLVPARQARRWRNAFGAWLRDLARLAIAELRQHPSSWPRSESIDLAPSVLSARRGIQRYARDVALNVVAIFVLMALFFLLL